jgi:hypothetical protein
MTPERLIKLLNDPTQLHHIPYEELKTLTLAYPYSHHLRQLLFLRAKQLGHHEYSRNLSAAAAYSLDRGLLFDLQQHKVPGKVEVLELKPIEALQRELLEKTVRNTDPVPALAVQPEVSRPVISTTPPPPSTVPPTPEEITVAPTPESEPLDLAAEVGDAPGVTPKAATVAQQLAEKSVAANQDILSETLAKLYARQGYRDKAVKMYERLILAFPEKSAYFAAQIAELKA